MIFHVRLVGRNGTVDGIGTNARFSGPMGIDYFDGNLYTVEYGSHTIRKRLSENLLYNFKYFLFNRETMIANLDNEVFFKKAFTDKIVLKRFVKDVLEIDLDFDKVETEKSFDPKIGNIDFKYDIFAESIDKRVIVEIQKVDYDYNFDRFLHYFLMAIAELQRSSKDYGIEKTVYAVIFITAPYKINQKTGIPIKDELLISSLNPKNIKGDELNIYGHSLLFLNPNYKNPEIPARIRDWLDLVYESMHHPEKPSINQNNDGIRRASEILDFEHISPSEWEKSKIREGRKMVQLIAKEEGITEGITIGVEREKERAIRKAITRGKLSLEEIAEDFGVSIDVVKELKKENQ